MVFSEARMSGSLIGVASCRVAETGLSATFIVHLDMSMVRASSEVLWGEATRRSIWMSSIDLGSLGYWMRPFSALSSAWIAGKAFSP